jgi:hypothetical protein
MSMRAKYNVFLLFFITLNLCAQDFKFGKISKEELNQKEYTQDPSAAAAVLFREVTINYDYVKDEGFMVQTYVHERIKIYNADGFKFGTISESLYQSGNTAESLSGIKAFTYNLKDGKIVETKLSKNDIFNEEVNKYRLRKKFTMPNLQEGSVIEYQYKIRSPFSSNIDEIILQYDIPIAKQEIKVAIPEYYTFNERTKGYLMFDIKKSSLPGQINFTSNARTNRDSRVVSTRKVSNSALTFRNIVSSISMDNVPALKEEPFVNNMDNYRSALKYELQFTKFPNSTIESYTTSWEKVVKKIYDFESFGGQLNKTRYFKEDLPIVLQGKVSEEDKTSAIYHFVKDRMHWNGMYGYTSDEGVKKAYDLKTGNIADINLILVGMLRAANLKANPVLISTRSNGVPLFPTMEGFNYVAASVNIGGGFVFLDATNKYAKPNLLPIRALNWSGRVVKENGTSTEFSLMPTLKSENTVLMSAEISNTGELEGKIRRSFVDYGAYIFRNNNDALDEDTYLEKLEGQFGGIEISEYVIKNKLGVGKPVTENFKFYTEDLVEFIDDKIYISPLLWYSEEENPFKLEQREYPIDFIYPRKNRYLITLKMPEGYRAEFLPEDMLLSLPDNQGSFKYKLGVIGGKSLQIAVEEHINVAVLSSLSYPSLKEYYKTIVQKQLEKVVLSKTDDNGNTESATGG